MEKRRSYRYHLEEVIRLEDGKERIPATMLDVSRRGMRVIINKPSDFNKIERISVELPGTGVEGIPCQIRRNVRSEESWEFGLEFAGETNAQMLLVDRWIDSLEKHRSDSTSLLSRRVPRTICAITDIECANKELVIHSAQNISTRGMMIRGSGELDRGEILFLKISSATFSRSISVETRVVYLIESSSKKQFQAGLSIVKINETDHEILQQFIKDTLHNIAILGYYKRTIREESSGVFQISGSKAVAMFHNLRDEACIVNLLDEENLCILETRIEEFGGIIFKVASPPNVSSPAFFSFTRNGASYFFSAKRKVWKDGYGKFQIPVRIYRGEKRAERRKVGGGKIKLKMPSIREPVPVQVLDSSLKGMQVEVYAEALSDVIPVIGGALEIAVGGETIPGEIRHIVEHLGDMENRIVYRIGFETGIKRKPPNAITYNAVNWIKTWRGPPMVLKNQNLLHSERISYKDHLGREIVGLLHTSNPELPAVVIIIPPAFGKKKESFAPLALTLLTNLTAAGENVAVLRYDGTNRPGESAGSNAQMGNEMIEYRIDQSYTDLEATMNWVYHSGKIRADKTILISFDMAALETRRLQTSLGDSRADYWISVMGVVSAQGALKNMLCGLDIIANHQMGMPIGTINLLGQLIDMDKMAADIMHLGYATTSDAREAMAQIESPVTWICGTHDRWTASKEAWDIMSVASPGKRKLIEIPSLHNIHASEDSIASFQMISEEVLLQLTGSSSPTVMPDKSELKELMAKERERSMAKVSLDLPGFWKSYMLGESIDGRGYDNYGELAEFQEFVQMELALLKPMAGESIADMGCGTGLISKAILFDLESSAISLAGTKFIGIDLMPELLIRANEKYEKLSREKPRLKEIEVTWKSLNLETSAGIREVLRKPGLKLIKQFKGKMRGISHECFDKLKTLDRKIMSEILSGKPINDYIRGIIEKNIGLNEALILEDINLCIRFIKGNLAQEDLKANLRQGTGPLSNKQLQNLISSDLALRKLDFGSWTHDGKLPLESNSLNAILGSLILPFLLEPTETVKEFARMLKPGGRILLSTMKPDCDILAIFSGQALSKKLHEDNLEKKRAVLGEEARLLSLEEDGWFQFLSEDELIAMMEKAGFVNIKISKGFGVPPQAIIATGEKRLTTYYNF